MSSCPAPDAILLDALGTLVALTPPAPLLRESLQRELGVVVTPAQAERAIEAEIAFYRSHFDEGRDPRSLAALRRACAEVVGDSLPASAGLAAAGPERITELLLSCLRFTAFGDVEPALTGLRERGLRTVVVSNWDVSLHDLLARLGLASLLDGIITSADAQARKPAREIFERALELAGVDAAAAVHVGDSVAEDVEGARSAGIRPILLRREPPAAGPAMAESQPPPPPDGVPTIATLRELADLCA